jgi:hypothetical protein
MTSANRIIRVVVAVCQSHRARKSKKHPGRCAHVNGLAVISVYLCSSVVPRLGFCGELR